jgi:hypothetical protein
VLTPRMHLQLHFSSLYHRFADVTERGCSARACIELQMRFGGMMRKEKGEKVPDERVGVGCG